MKRNAHNNNNHHHHWLFHQKGSGEARQPKALLQSFSSSFLALIARQILHKKGTETVGNSSWRDVRIYENWYRKTRDHSFS
jgi:hypothetical protein